MLDRPLRVVQINTVDCVGGAAMVAFNLHQEYRRRGYDSWMAVRSKFSDDPYVMELAAPISRGSTTLETDLCSHSYSSWTFCDNLPDPPDIVHCHNLHGGYFDFKALPYLSRTYPMVITLHDAWLLAGHCAHSFDCDHWLTGCGECPGLDIYPPITKDVSSASWNRKKKVYHRTRVYVTTPCLWLMNKVKQSILAKSVIGARIIHNGVDLSTFHPKPHDKVRNELDIKPNAKVVLFSAYGIVNNMWKDYPTLLNAVVKACESLQHEDVLFLALGDHVESQTIGKTTIQFIPYDHNRDRVADYYSSCDIYIHAARADTFPNVVLEALACGVPVIATAVGGIPEQIKGLLRETCKNDILNRFSPSDATGILVAQGDSENMGRAIVDLITNSELRRRLGLNAARDAIERFDLKTQADSYLALYETMLHNAKSSLGMFAQTS